jgi:hypothetical protein
MPVFARSGVQAITPAPQTQELFGSVPENSAPQPIEPISPMTDRPSNGSEFNPIEIEDEDNVFPSQSHSEYPPLPDTRAGTPIVPPTRSNMGS